jgi:hypothetical protein
VVKDGLVSGWQHNASDGSGIPPGPGGAGSGLAASAAAAAGSRFDGPLLTARDLMDDRAAASAIGGAGRDVLIGDTAFDIRGG